MSKKVEVIAIELFFALRTSKKSRLQNIKSLPKSAFGKKKKKKIGNQY